MNFNFIRYNNLLFRILLAFFATCFVLLYGEPLNIFWVIRDFDFYRSFAGTFLITFALINIVHYLTKILDGKLSWEENKLLRAFLQFILCWGLPCIISYYMAILYFHIMGIDIDHTDYELMEFPLINLLLLFLNYYYYSRYGSIMDKLKLATLNSLVEQNNGGIEKTNNLPPLIIQFNGHVTQFDVCKDVACFYKAGDGYWIKSLDGSSVSLSQSLVQMENIYGGHHFFKLNRALIINRKAIKNYTANEKSGSLQIEMYKDIGLLEHHSKNDLFTINSKHAQEFIDWFDNGE